MRRCSNEQPFYLVLIQRVAVEAVGTIDDCLAALVRRQPIAALRAIPLTERLEVALLVSDRSLLRHKKFRLRVCGWQAAVRRLELLAVPVPLLTVRDTVLLL